MEQESQASEGWVVLARKLHRYFLKQRLWSHLGSLLKVKFGGLKARERRPQIQDKTAKSMHMRVRSSKPQQCTYAGCRSDHACAGASETDAAEHRQCEDIVAKLCNYATALIQKTPIYIGNTDLLTLVHAFWMCRGAASCFGDAYSR